MLSAKMEDYLKAIYRLEREGEAPVATSTIAETVGVTPPTATSMIEKLTDQEFLEREKYKGVTLTPEGETIALEVIRHHRLLETFLTEELGYDWATVHEEAEILEHHISEEFEQRLAEALDDPDVDPHGDPIPNDALEPIEDVPVSVLSDYDEGVQVEVARVRDREPDELTYLDGVGITPGTVLSITEVAPIGMVTVSLDSGDSVSLPEGVADAIQVHPPESDRAENGVTKA
ncbi:metal-dependent transcriptional regulator [Haloarcula halophila]|uniref:metal-dependent transcriptional regulator n=1 Tax=Haloarcula TaxID=2237 RepID=UPI0023E3ABF8|nr:metal-dependent transcriptional regulator [Halomicroarcula sp. DFY41]